MGLFKLFKRKTHSTKSSTPAQGFEIDDTDLKILINQAISTFQENQGFDGEQIIEAINRYAQEKDLAVALYRFIPIAYCKMVIPEPEYPDHYLLHISQHDQKKVDFASDRIYTAVLAESRARLAKDPSHDKVFPILIHSADFDAINKALDNGSALNDLVCSPPYFL